MASIDRRPLLSTPDLRTPEGAKSVEKLRPRDPDGWKVEEKTSLDRLPPETWKPANESALDRQRREEAQRDRSEARQKERTLRQANESLGRTQVVRTGVSSITQMVSKADALARRAAGAESDEERQRLQKRFNELREQIDRKAQQLGLTEQRQAGRADGADAGAALDPEGLGIADADLSTRAGAVAAGRFLDEARAMLARFDGELDRRAAEVVDGAAGLDGLQGVADAPPAEEAGDRTRRAPDEAEAAQSRVAEDEVFALVR